MKQYRSINKCTDEIKNCCVYNKYLKNNVQSQYLNAYDKCNVNIAAYTIKESIDKSYYFYEYVIIENHIDKYNIITSINNDAAEKYKFRLAYSNEAPDIVELVYNLDKDDFDEIGYVRTDIQL